MTIKLSELYKLAKHAEEVSKLAHGPLGTRDLREATSAAWRYFRDNTDDDVVVALIEVALIAKEHLIEPTTQTSKRLGAALAKVMP